MTEIRVAHEIIVDYDQNHIAIDGQILPFAVERDIRVSYDGGYGHVVLDFLADNVVVIGGGTTRRPVVASFASELRWAAREGVRIVREGLARA